MVKKLHCSFRKKLLKSLLLISGFCFVFTSAQQAAIVESITENQGLPSNYIFSIVQDKDGFIWLGTDKGLVKYANGKFVTYDADSGLPGNYINQIVPDGNKGLFIYLSEKGLFYFDTVRKKITINYKNFGPKPSGVYIFKSPLEPNYFLIRNENNFFAVHNKNLKSLCKVTAENNDGNKTNDYFLYENGKKVKLFDTNSQLRPKKVKNGRWSYEVFYGKGIARYKDREIYDTINEKNGLGSNLVSDFLKTKEGDIYFSSFGGGISIMRSHNNRRIFPLQNLKVRAINYEAGKYYLLSDGYVYIMDRKQLLAKIFVRKDALTFFIEKDKLYLGSFGGLDEYKIINNSLKHIKNYALGTGISKIRKFEDKILFSSYGNGVYRSEDKNFKNYKYPVFNNIENFFQNHDSTFVITSYESGFSLLDKNLKFIKNYSKKDGLLSNNISFTYGETDTLWVGHKKGLSAMVKGKIVKNFTEKDGFSGNSVKIIFRSQKDDLWLVTDKMILKKTGNVLKPLGSLNIFGDKENHIIKSIYWKTLDELAIATEDNFSIINLNQIFPNTKPAEPFLEKVMVDDKNIGKEHQIKLSADNFLTEIHFKSVDNDLLDKTQYYYQTNGGNWSVFPDDRVLRFHHLDYGKYNIRVKTLNSDGYEKVYPKEFLLQVLPHFYLRFWFILCSILFLVSIFGAVFYNYYRKKFHHRLQLIQLQKNLEQERKRISRDLHDNIGAYTTSLINKVDQMKINFEGKCETQKLDDIRETATYIMSLLRQTIWVLSSRETSLDSFFDNFMSYVQKITGSDSKIKIKFAEDIFNNRRLDPTVAIALFRILQEAFHNILKHSEATIAEFQIESHERISILIKDNGKGFMQERNEGNGLKNMKERAKEAGFNLHMYSSSQGTTIQVTEKQNKQ